MAYIKTLVPNELISGGGWTSISNGYPGSGVVEGNLVTLTDGNISTGITGQGDPLAPKLLRLKVNLFGSPIADNERIRSVQILSSQRFSPGRHYMVLYSDSDFTQPILNTGVTTRWNGDSVFWVLGSSSNKVNVNSAPATTGPSGEWEANDLDSLYLEVSSNDPAYYGRVELSSLWVNALVQARSSPTIYPQTVGNSGKVAKYTYFQWANVDDSDIQRSFHLKVFDESTGSSPGFDPDIDTPVYDSGVRVGARKEFTLPQGHPLTYGEQYYAVVKTASDFNGSEWWGEWSSKVLFSVLNPVVVTVTEPASIETVSASPEVKWTIADGNGDSPGSWEVKIFTGVQASNPNFNPDITKPVWASTSPNTFFMVAKPTVYLLNNVEYVAYVKTVSLNLKVDSDWAYKDFQLDLAQPNPPLLTLTPDSSNARIHVESEPIDAYLAPLTIEVERSDDGGITWIPLLRVEPESSLVDVYDYEASLFGPVTYRAFSVTRDSGSAVRSDPTEDTVSLGIGKVWLKNPKDPEQNVQLKVEDDWLTLTYYRSRQQLKGLGASKPKVIRGDGDYISFSLNLLIMDEVLKWQVQRLLDGEDVMYLQTSKGNWYVEISGDYSITQSLWDELRGEEKAWKLSVNLVEVVPDEI